MQKLTWSLLLSIAIIAIGAGPAYAQTPDPVVLTIEAPAEAVQGEKLEAVLLLTDGTGKPIAGETIILYERVRFFNYTDRVKIGQVRTDFLGKGVLHYTPTVKDEGGLIAEYRGSEVYAAATASTSLTIAPEMRSVVTATLPLALPRGVTPLWVLVLLVAVWVAFGAALYQIARLPGERMEPSTDA